MAKEKKDVKQMQLNLLEREEGSSVSTSKKTHLATNHDSDIDSSKTKNKTNKAQRQELFLPVTGFVWLYPEEISVVNHPVFQRLGRINQLGLTHLVWRGATHKRIEHAFGVLHIVQRMIDAIEHTSKKSLLKNAPSGTPIQEEEYRFIRLGALLHDIGHVASGHTLEDEICLISRHDSDYRLDTLLEDKKWIDNDNQTLAQLIDINFENYVPEVFNSKVSASILARLLIRKIPEKNHDKFWEYQELVEKSDIFRLQICRDIIGNTICADLLDYLYRDWYHIGKSRTFDDRLFQYMDIKPTLESQNLEIRGVDKQNPGKKSKPKSTDQLVIYLGKRPKIRTDAISAILDLLEWRYQLAESVYFHRTKIAASSMLDRALSEIWDKKANGIEKKILGLSDEELLAECKRMIGNGKKEKDVIALKLLNALENRQLFTVLKIFSYEDFRDEVRNKIQSMYAETKEPYMARIKRITALRVLERDFGLAPGSVSMYCPKSGMNGKIAEVNVAVDNKIFRFCDFEKERNAGISNLTEGHLHAQLRRFKRLWKVYFFIERKEYKRIKGNKCFMIDLRRVVKEIILNDTDEKPQDVAYQVARNLIYLKDSPWYGKKLRQPVAAAHGNPDISLGMYPFGVPSLRSFIEP
ncbi:MAG: HD domain-containing protein [Candidatus Omnitrophica bacterium]|nr:HD domain-containing protein [Candidatus Omnitrophota bacterium]